MYQSEFTTDGVNIRFSASLEHVDMVCAEAKKVPFLQAHAKAMFAVQLLLREICNNAVLHGCKSDPSKSVACHIGREGTSVVIEVADEGPGYDWRARMQEARQEAADQGPEASMQMTSGRGHSILLAYAAKVLFNEQGNRVTMRVPLKDEGLRCA